jgi:hypothetical protein
MYILEPSPNAIGTNAPPIEAPPMSEYLYAVPAVLAIAFQPLPELLDNKDQDDMMSIKNDAVIVKLPGKNGHLLTNRHKQPLKGQFSMTASQIEEAARFVALGRALVGEDGLVPPKAFSKEQRIAEFNALNALFLTADGISDDLLEEPDDSRATEVWNKLFGGGAKPT